MRFSRGKVHVLFLRPFLRLLQQLHASSFHVSGQYLRHLQQLHSFHVSGQFLAGPTAAAPQTSLLSPCPSPCFTACVIFHRSHAHKPRRSVLDGSPHLGPSHDGGKASLTASPYTVHAHMVLIQMASPSWMPSSKHLSDAQCQAVRHATSKHAAGQTWHTPTRLQTRSKPPRPNKPRRPHPRGRSDFPC